MMTRLRIWLALLPTLGLVALLLGSSVVYGVAQSLGYLPFVGQTTLSLDAYRNVLTHPDYATEFWRGLGFSLWISGAATLLSAGLALLIVAVGGRWMRSASSLLILNINLAFPHVVWAIALSLLLAQSGVLARIAAALGWITAPAQFPVVVRDQAGIGILLAYVLKETPFLVLILLSILRSQPAAYHLVAANLGANRWQRLRYITLPVVLPGLLAGSLLVFAFVFGAYEVPALLGVGFPQMLAVLALEFFLNPDLRNRAEAMAISVIMAVIVLLVATLGRRSLSSKNANATNDQNASSSASLRS